MIDYIGVYLAGQLVCLPLGPGGPGSPGMPGNPSWPESPGGPGGPWNCEAKMPAGVFCCTEELDIRSAGQRNKLHFKCGPKGWKLKQQYLASMPYHDRFKIILQYTVLFVETASLFPARRSLAITHIPLRQNITRFLSGCQKLGNESIYRIFWCFCDGKNRHRKKELNRIQGAGQATKVILFLDQLGALCQWQGCQFLCYKSMNCKNKMILKLSF